MLNPLVSVIIPNYNHAQFLEQRITTVLSQTYSNFEVILLDDCSTDNSAAIIERYRPAPRFSHIVYNKTNSGSAFRQWHTGIGLSRGEYIWIAESDDWCEPSFLDTLMSGLLENRDCVLAYCQSYYVEDRNNIVWQSGHPQLRECIDGKLFVRRYMLSGTAIYNASMAVWKKSVFAHVPSDFTSYKYCGDWLFWIELSMHGNVFISGKLLNYYRKHSSTASRLSIKSGDNFAEALTIFLSLYNNGRISFKELTKSFENIYPAYKAVARLLTPGKNAQIQRLFFTVPGMKPHVYRFYCKYLMSAIVHKMQKPS